jgi:hypothetical protein
MAVLGAMGAPPTRTPYPVPPEKNGKFRMTARRQDGSPERISRLDLAGFFRDL